MDGKMLARIGANTFVAVALTETAIELTRKDDAPTSSPMPQHRPATNPLRDAQRRCQQLGQAAANDTECLHVWAETRDRFLGKTPAPAAPLTREGR